MAEVKNAFLKAKMNKDVDDRLVPTGEYRHAVNVQVTTAESSDAGALQNVLGNTEEREFITADNCTCIGFLADENSDFIYLFFTDNDYADPVWQYHKDGTYSNNYIYKYNAVKGTASVLAQGAFLNFHKSFPITGINLLEDLLFWTDNRNQPRKINVTKSSADYTTEDHISVAKYSPYKVINVFKESELAPGNYETTMKDVSSLFLPDGGTAVVTSASSANVILNNINIPFYPGEPKAGMTVKKLNANNEIVSLGGSVDATVDSYDSATKTVTLIPSGLQISVDTVLVFNPNPYYIAKYPGNPELNQDKFIRFSYRFKFSDGEYSLQAPFTQICFIPEQDGYFMTKDSEPDGTGIKGDEVDTGDEIETVETTVVGFMQNKVNEIRLQVPLPTAGSALRSDLHIEEIDILYSESNSSNTRIVETIPVEDLASSNEEVFEYVYQSKKPYKSLPNRDTTRVYDKIPVRALAQEVVSNRIVYANYQDKHTPPESLRFSVASGPKSNFSVGTGDAAVSSPADNSNTLGINNLSGGVKVGWIISGAAISNNTPGQVPVYIIAVQSTGLGYTLTLDTEISVSIGSPVYFSAPSPESYTTSAVEYPNHTLKTNRSYQVGLVLLDRFGRQSTVILSNSKDIVTVNGQSSSGSTFYAPYIDDGIEASEWFGNSIKILFEEKIGPESYDYSSYAPGVYNGDKSSEDYNPLGWYSYKIVVKQTEQEYYNVYTGGAIKGLPYNYDPNSSDVLRPSVSYISLVNDNINKVPRDLTKVGPLDKKFRSSVRLFGRVENHELNDNRQFYPGARSFTATSIEGLFDGFDVLNFTDSSHNVRPITARDNPFSAFYKSDSDPFIAEINTSQSVDQQFGIQNLPLGTHSDTYPKIDQLAIFETAPVESLLDIFWETSTSGLVSDLNFLIDTAGEELGASNITDWNTEPYTESIRENENVLNSPFTVKDAFGANVDPNAIESVSMSVGWVVTPSSQSLNPNYNTPDPSDLFELYEVSGSVGYYQIRVTDEHDKHIFYSGDQNIRRFVVYLTITLLGQQSTTVLKYLNLSNQPPHIDHDQHDCENPGVIQRRVLRNDDGIKAIFTAYNGADRNRRDCANPNNGNYYTHPYLLQYEDLRWSIKSIKNLNEHDPNMGATDYTGNSFNITVGPSQDQGQADNQGSQDEGAEVQLNQTWWVGDSLSEVNAYEFKLQVQDAGGSGATDEVTFEIDYRAEVTEVFSIEGVTNCERDRGAVYQGVGFVVTGIYGSGGGCYIVPSNNWSAKQYLEEKSKENNQINSRAISIGGHALYYKDQNGTVLGQTDGWVYRNTRENAVDAFKAFYGRNWECQGDPRWNQYDVAADDRELYTYFTVNSTDNL